MTERISALVPVTGVTRSPSVGNGRIPQAGEELCLTLAAMQGDGSVELQGEGMILRLPDWPLSETPPPVGSVLRLLVRAVTPQVELVWLNAPARMSAGTDDSVPASRWDPVMSPRLVPQRPEASTLGRDWREALLGRLAASAARFRQEAGSQLSGSLLQAAPELALAGLRSQSLAEAPLPLILPMWLWGGPPLALSVEDAVPGSADEPDEILDLVLEVSLLEIGQVRLRLQARHHGVVLVFVASAAGCHWLEERRGLLYQAAERGGSPLLACHIGEQDVLPGLALGRHGISLLETHRVSAALFAVAAEVLLLLCPPPARLSPVYRSG